MAIDIRTERAGNERCKYYKGKYVDRNRVLEKDAIVQGVFYSKTVVPMTETISRMGDVLSPTVTVTIETNDTINDLNVNDYVELGDKLFIVSSITKQSQYKKFSRRPMTTTRISLRR